MGGLRKEVCGLHLGTKQKTQSKIALPNQICECMIKKKLNKKNQVQIKLVRDMQYKLVDSFIVIIN